MPLTSCATLTTALLCAHAVCGAARSGSDNRITIRVHNYAQIKASELIKAERITDDIWSQAGVQLTWIECSERTSSVKNAACEIPASPTDLAVNLLPRSVSRRFEFGADTCGVALEDAQGGSGFDAWVFYDLVKNAATKEDLTPAASLRTVIVHELSHLLLSTNSHSAFGIMRANWSSKELRAVEHRAMHFSSSQARGFRKP